MNVSSVYMSVYLEHACCPSRLEDGIRSPGIGVTDSYEPPCECWKLKLGQQQVLFTAEPSY